MPSEIVKGQYADTITVGPMERRAPTQEEYDAEYGGKDKISGEKLRGRLGLTTDQLIEAQQMFQFPKHTSLSQRGWPWPRYTHLQRQSGARIPLAQSRVTEKTRGLRDLARSAAPVPGSAVGLPPGVFGHSFR
jgi:hypothetical protein